MNPILKKTQPIRHRRHPRKAGWAVFSVLLSMLSLQSCLDNAGVEYSEFSQIDERGIPQDREYDFAPAPSDSASIGMVPFDLILVVRYSSTTKSREVVFNIEQFSLSQDLPDTTSVRVRLFDNDDRPLGRGNLTLFEKADTLCKGMKIPEGFTVSVASPLPQEETSGIRSIGVVLSRTGSSQKLNLFHL